MPKPLRLAGARTGRGVIIDGPDQQAHCRKPEGVLSCILGFARFSFIISISSLLSFLSFLVFRLSSFLSFLPFSFVCPFPGSVSPSYFFFKFIF